MLAVVVDVADPEKRGRVRLKIPDLFLDPETQDVIPSPWCEARGGWGPEAGALNVPPLGAQVWCHVRYSSDGEVYQLVYEPGGRVGGAGTSHAPAVGRGEDDETVNLKVGGRFRVPSADTALRVPPLDAGGTVVRQERRSYDEIEGLPPSPNAGEYPQNRVLKTPGGVVVEVDDTPGAVRVHVWHPEGAYVEVSEKGVYAQRQTKRWDETMEHDTRYVGGDLRTRADGNVLTGVGGNHVEEARRRVILAGEIDLQARVHMLLEAGGRYDLSVAGAAKQKFSSSLSTVVGMDASTTCAGRMHLTALREIQLVSGVGVNVAAGAGGMNVVGALGPVPTPVALAGPLVLLLERLGPFSSNPGGWAEAVTEMAALLASKTLRAG